MAAPVPTRKVEVSPYERRVPVKYHKHPGNSGNKKKG